MKNHIMGMTILLVAAALLAVACGTTNKTARYGQEESRLQEALQAQTAQVAKAVTDSVQYSIRNLQEEMTELKATFAEQIPMTQAQETIPVQNLIDLPEGAKYGAAYGRASVEALKQGDNIVLTGRCDSVARQCTVYERQTFRQRNTIDSLNAVIDNLHSKLVQKAYEEVWDTGSTVVETAETATAAAPKPHRWRWLLGGAVFGIAASVTAGLLWKRFSLGKVIKGLISKLI